MRLPAIDAYDEPEDAASSPKGNEADGARVTRLTRSELSKPEAERQTLKLGCRFQLTRRHTKLYGANSRG